MNCNLALKLVESFDEERIEKDLILDRAEVVEFYKNLRLAMFMNYYKSSYSAEEVNEILEKSRGNLRRAFGEKYKEFKSIIDEFYDKVIDIREELLLDIKAIYDGDPASNSYSEIVLTYPGFIAISAYRIAHEFYLKGLKFLARIISEYAHGRTGVDINPGAQIGKSFFIDHGTGIVIGETTIIGDNAKIYQGVTLGALSLKDGHNLKNKKRHPTLKNNVTIYSNASILGGETVIGNNVVIGGNSFITRSINDNMICKFAPCGLEFIENKGK